MATRQPASQPAEGVPALADGAPSPAGRASRPAAGDSPAAELAAPATDVASASVLGDGAWPPWLAGLVRRWHHRAAPDLIDCVIAAGCFAALTLPVLAGAASRIGSPLAVAVFGALAAAPLIVRRRWPLASVAVITAVYVTATLVGVRFTPFVSNAGPKPVRKTARMRENP